MVGEICGGLRILPGVGSGPSGKGVVLLIIITDTENVANRVAIMTTTVSKKVMGVIPD